MDKSYCQSFDTPMSDDGSITLGDTLANEETPYSDTFTKDAISKALSCLNSREYKVITEFYGLEGQIERPIKEIAKEMNLGDERVRQLRKSGIKKLKAGYKNLLETLL